MTRLRAIVPDAVPVLSPGRHRHPRRGACFMEMASYLAGERWSDEPACTHALLADLARRVNDLSSDAGRRALAPLIPSVIGVLGEGPTVDARIAWRCATGALAVVDERRQRLLALAVLTVGALLDEQPRAEQVLTCAPAAARWAHLAVRRAQPDRSLRAFTRNGAPVAVRVATQGIAEAGGAADARLHALLVAGIEEGNRPVREAGDPGDPAVSSRGRRPPAAAAR